MTLTLKACFWFLALCTATFVQGFGPQLVQPSHQRARTRVAAGRISTTALYNSRSEPDATYLLAKAQECAYSDAATMDDAKYYLRELLHIQSGCVVGTIAGRDLCDNQESVAEIVLRLQAKLDTNKKDSRNRQAAAAAANQEPQHEVTTAAASQ